MAVTANPQGWGKAVGEIGNRPEENARQAQRLNSTMNGSTSGPGGAPGGFKTPESSNTGPKQSGCPSARSRATHHPHTAPSAPL